MRSYRNKENKPRPGFACGRGFTFYVISLIASVVFTQAMRSPVSVVLLWFMILLPFGMYLLALAAKNGISVFVRSTELTTEKNKPTDYEFRIINSSLLPIAFAEAYVSVPSTDGVRCVEKRLMLSILPKGAHIFKDKIVFKYRGKYNIGVGDIYLSDPLSFFIIKKEVDTYDEIYVLPRRRYLDRSTDNAPSDLPTDSNKVVSGIESSETNRIREYRSGDSLKHIHWKLSSKMQDFQVNEYKPNMGKNVYVFCDYSANGDDSYADAEKPVKKKKQKKKKTIKLNIKETKAPSSMMSTSETVKATNDSVSERAEAMAALAKSREELQMEIAVDKAAMAEAFRPDGERFNAEEYYQQAGAILPEYRDDMDAFCADGVSEIAIGAVMHELEAGNTVTLMWFDNRVSVGFCSYTLHTYSDFDLIFRQFATAPEAPSELKVTRLPDLIEDVENPTFIFATSKADLKNVSDFVDAGNRMGADAVEILLFNPKERYKNQRLRAEYVDTCRLRFIENNITLSEVRIAEDKQLFS